MLITLFPLPLVALRVNTGLSQLAVHDLVLKMLNWALVWL